MTRSGINSIFSSPYRSLLFFSVPVGRCAVAAVEFSGVCFFLFFIILVVGFPLARCVQSLARIDRNGNSESCVCVVGQI